MSARARAVPSSASSASPSSRKLLAANESAPVDLEPLPKVTLYIAFQIDISREERVPAQALLLCFQHNSVLGEI